MRRARVQRGVIDKLNDPTTTSRFQNNAQNNIQ